MAKLNEDMQQKTEEAQGSFEPIPPGAYHARLREVDTDRSGGAGPYWSWEYEIVEGEHQGRRLWNNTSLSEQALWKLKETYEAFGVGTDADTDDLCGQTVKLVVTQRTIQEGQRKGELANQVDRVVAKDEDFEAPEASGQPATEDIFN